MVSEYPLWMLGYFNVENFRVEETNAIAPSVKWNHAFIISELRKKLILCVLYNSSGVNFEL